MDELSKPETEPVGRGHELCSNWAYWHRGGSPVESAEWSAKERIGPSRDIEPPDEAKRVDRIVARIRVEYPAYGRMLKRYYLGSLSYWEIAGQLGYTTGFVRLSIQAAADLVARRFEEM